MLASPMNAVDQILIAWRDGQDLVPIQMRCPLLAHSGRASRLTNVCFGGKNGRDADLSRCPLMTQSGHPRYEARQAAI